MTSQKFKIGSVLASPSVGIVRFYCVIDVVQSTLIKIQRLKSSPVIAKGKVHFMPTEQLVELPILRISNIDGTLTVSDHTLSTWNGEPVEAKPTPPKNKPNFHCRELSENVFTAYEKSRRSKA